MGSIGRLGPSICIVLDAKEQEGSVTFLDTATNRRAEDYNILRGYGTERLEALSQWIRDGCDNSDVYDA